MIGFGWHASLCVKDAHMLCAHDTAQQLAICWASHLLGLTKSRSTEEMSDTRGQEVCGEACLQVEGVCACSPYDWGVISRVLAIRWIPAERTGVW